MNLKEIICKCPKCGESFVLGDALEEQAVEQIRAELASLNDEEIKRRIDVEKSQALEEGKKQAQAEILEQTKKKQDEIDEVRTELMDLQLEKINSDSELNRLRKQQETAIILKLDEQKNLWEAEKISSETEFKLQIQKLKDDLRRASERAEQGSMQAQGEAREIAIEETLKHLFPSDEILEVKKGQRGADCLLVVRNSVGRPVGKILFESKDTKSFSSDWITKLKSDTINEGAQFAVLVTTAWPSDHNKAHLREGVWICGFHEYQILVRALRQSLVELAKATVSEGAREGKAQVMYDFLISQEFAYTIEKMIGPIYRMNEQLQKEKRAITRLWKERETLIEGSISGTESLYMKIQGIAQVNLPSIAGLEAIEDLREE